MLAHPPAVAAALVLGRTPSRDATMYSRSAQQRTTLELQVEAMACFEFAWHWLGSCRAIANMRRHLHLAARFASRAVGYFTLL